MTANQDIPRLASEIAGRYRGEDHSLSLLRIARGEGVKVIEDGRVHCLEEGEYGKILFDGEEWIIIFDETQSYEKMRFTIAHELGHYFLKHNVDLREFYVHIENLKKKHGRRTERQADLFARCLLDEAQRKDAAL